MSPVPRILKIKTGYNPNSSSMGTEVTAFLWGSAAFSLVANALMAVVMGSKAGRRARDRAQDTAADTTEAVDP